SSASAPIWSIGSRQEYGRGLVGRAVSGRGGLKFIGGGRSANLNLVHAQVLCAPGHAVVEFEGHQVIWNGLNVLGGVRIVCSDAAKTAISTAQYGSGIGVIGVARQSCDGIASPVESGLAIKGIRWLLGDVFRDAALACTEVAENSEQTDLTTSNDFRLPALFGTPKAPGDVYPQTNCSAGSVVTGFKMASVPGPEVDSATAIVGVQVVCSDLALQ
ncbi:MAG: hypothetical protein AAB425_08250, partial [Bdellovibrionota bacterium]